MSLARTQLLKRLATINSCLIEPATIDGSPAQTEKNAVANMLRSGLAVLSFAITEAFIRDRSGEILQTFNSSIVTFGKLSEKLQKAVTINALEAILFRAKNYQDGDPIAWVMSQLPPIVTASSNISQISAFAFGQNRSNIGSDDISTMLSAFGVSGGWDAVANLAKRVGIGGVVNFSQAFKNLADRRHKAAHDISLQVPINDLKDSLRVILGICASVDLLLSEAVARHNVGVFPSQAGNQFDHTQVKLRFVVPHPSKAGMFSEQTENLQTNNKRTFKVHADLNLAMVSIIGNARTRNEHVIRLDSSGQPIDWITNV